MASSTPTNRPSRRSRRRQNELKHLPPDLIEARRARQGLILQWKHTTTEEERAELADQLLLAMESEDKSREHRDGRYVSWIDRRRREEPVACMPLTLLPWPGRVTSTMPVVRGATDVPQREVAPLTGLGSLRWQINDPDATLFSRKVDTSNDKLYASVGDRIVLGHDSPEAKDERCLTCLQWRPLKDFSKGQRRSVKPSGGHCLFCCSARDCDNCSVFKHRVFFAKSSDRKSPGCLVCMDWLDRVNKAREEEKPCPARPGDELSVDEAEDLQLRFAELLEVDDESDDD